MAIRRLSPKTQLHYIRHVKRFADFLDRPADKATAEDVHRYQLWLASIGTTVPTVNLSATALRFFFKVTLKRRDLADEVVSTREPRRLPVVLSPEEVARLLAAARNIKHKAFLSLAYATGLRASEVVSLKLTDIDSDRMVVRVEQGKGKKDRYVILSPNTGSFTWPRHAPALPSASAFIHCGIALPPISWSTRPISGLSRFCSDTRSSTRPRFTPASPSARSAR
jgi:site-specific recombinase XerD